MTSGTPTSRRRRTDLAPHLRLVAQGLARPIATSPEAVVTHLGALQAQDHAGALWSVGLRMANATRVDVERAIHDRTIVRTWPMRGTLHLVPAADAAWMLELLAPRVLRSRASVYRYHELDQLTLRRIRSVVERVLKRERMMTRGALFAELDAAHVATAGQRGIHILQCLCMERMLCQGPHGEKEPTFVLFDEWIGSSRTPSRDEALQTLAKRYFTSHGPASVRDFANWTGLSLLDARAALQLAKPSLASIERDGDELWMSSTLEEPNESLRETHLLPGFDEYLLGYRDRSAVLAAEHVDRIVPGGNGVFRATLVLDAMVRGTWRRARRGGAMTLDVTPFTRITAAQKKEVDAAASRYAAFLGVPVALEWTS